MPRIKYQDSQEYAQLGEDFKAEVDHILESNLYIAVVRNHNGTVNNSFRFNDPHYFFGACFGFTLNDEGGLSDYYHLRTFATKAELERFEWEQEPA